MRKFLFLTLAMLSVSGDRALADQVSLKNGDRLSGTIVKSDGKTLLLHTNYAGDIELKWRAVQGIQSTGVLHIEFSDGKPAAGTVTTSGEKLEISTTNGTVETETASVKSIRNDAQEAVYEKTLHAGLLDDWKAGVNFGLALTRGNSQTKNLSLAFLASRQTQRDKLGLYSNAVYASNDTAGATPSTRANAIGGGLRYDHDLTPRLFSFAAGDFFSDALQGFKPAFGIRRRRRISSSQERSHGPGLPGWSELHAGVVHDSFPRFRRAHSRRRADAQTQQEHSSQSAAVFFS